MKDARFPARTKIIATIGPASDNLNTLRSLIRSGVRIFRLNFSHDDARGFRPLVERLRALEAEAGYPLTLLQDLSGPKIRTCDIEEPPREIARHEELLLGLPGRRGEALLPFICLDQPELLATLGTDDRVSLSDGVLQFEVVARVDSSLLRLRALVSGVITPRKGIAFPGRTASIAALTDKDRRDLREGAALGFDAVAVSFVQGPEDILQTKAELAALGLSLPVVAKLERQGAISNLDAVIAAADAVMVARGDLGLDCPLASLPMLQKRIIAACNAAAKPVIVATHMLLSMVSSRVPSRAETMDVANAILDGADCLMLSEETAVGAFPVEAVEHMAEIARAAEDLHFERIGGPVHPANEGAPRRFLAYAASLLAHRSLAKAVIAHTATGETARFISACRPEQPVIALCPDPRIRRFLNFSWGVLPEAADERLLDHLDQAEEFAMRQANLSEGDTAVIVVGRPGQGRSGKAADLIKMFVVE